MRRTISRSLLVRRAGGAPLPFPAASAATRRSKLAATRGEQIASPRATLSITVTNVFDGRLPLDVAGYACFGAAQHVVVILDHAERHDASERDARQDRTHHAAAVGYGHIHKNDIRLDRGQGGKRLFAARRGGDDRNPRVPAEDLGQAFAVQAGVRHDRDPDHRLGSQSDWGVGFLTVLIQGAYPPHDHGSEHGRH